MITQILRLKKFSLLSIETTFSRVHSFNIQILKRRRFQHNYSILGQASEI